MSEQKSVDLFLAKKAAFVYAKSKWGNIAIGDGTPVYGINDNEIRAYVFPVGKQGVEPNIAELNRYVAEKIPTFVQARYALKDALAQRDSSLPAATTKLKDASARFNQNRIALLDSERIGTVVINADKAKYPLIMMYDGIPCTNTGPAIAYHLGKKNKRFNLKRPPIFRMPDGYGYPQIYSELAENNGKKVLISVFNVDHTFIEPRYQRPPRIETAERTKQNETIWNALGEQSGDQPKDVSTMGMLGWTLTFTDLYKFYLSNVPNLIWTRGCSPTAAAMVLAYWDTRGYPKLVDNEVSKNEYDLIDQLADAMDTDSDGGTKLKYIDDGIRAVCNDSKYGNGYSYWVSDGDENQVWEKIVVELFGGHPCHLNLRGHEKYGDHSVALIGCRATMCTMTFLGMTFTFPFNFITIHDTWDTTKDVEIPYGGSTTGSDSDWVLIRVHPGCSASSSSCESARLIQNIAKEDQKLLYLTLAKRAPNSLAQGVNEILKNVNLTEEFNRLLNSSQKDLDTFSQQILSASQLCKAILQRESDQDNHKFSKRSALELIRILNLLKQKGSPELVKSLDLVILGIHQIEDMDVVSLRKKLVKRRKTSLS